MWRTFDMGFVFFRISAWLFVQTSAHAKDVFQSRLLLLLLLLLPLLLLLLLLLLLAIVVVTRGCFCEFCRAKCHDRTGMRKLVRNTPACFRVLSTTRTNEGASLLTYCMKLRD